eukprot:3482760-Rhodomonas_salina.1
MPKDAAPRKKRKASPDCESDGKTPRTPPAVQHRERAADTSDMTDTSQGSPPRDDGDEAPPCESFDGASASVQKDLADLISQAESFDPAEEQSIDEQIKKLEKQKQLLAAKREQTDISLKNATQRANKIISTMEPKMKEVVRNGDIQTLNEKLRLLKTQRTDLESSLQKVNEEIKTLMVGMDHFNLFRDIQEKAIKAEKLQKEFTPQPAKTARSRQRADKKRSREELPEDTAAAAP